MTTKIVLDVNPDVYRARTYDIPWISRTFHRIGGRGVHNPAFNHLLEVWDNTKRAVEGKPGVYIDPTGHETTERASFLLSPQAIVISASPRGETQVAGDELTIGDVIEVSIGYLTAEISLGEFEVIVPRAAHNPQLRKVQ